MLITGAREANTCCWNKDCELSPGTRHPKTKEIYHMITIARHSLLCNCFRGLVTRPVVPIGRYRSSHCWVSSFGRRPVRGIIDLVLEVAI